MFPNSFDLCVSYLLSFLSPVEDLKTFNVFKINLRLFIEPNVLHEKHMS